MDLSPVSPSQRPTGFASKLAGRLREESQTRFHLQSEQLFGMGPHCSHIVHVGRPSAANRIGHCFRIRNCIIQIGPANGKIVRLTPKQHRPTCVPKIAKILDVAPPMNQYFAWMPKLVKRRTPYTNVIHMYRRPCQPPPRPASWVAPRVALEQQANLCDRPWAAYRALDGASRGQAGGKATATVVLLFLTTQSLSPMTATTSRLQRRQAMAELLTSRCLNPT